MSRAPLFSAPGLLLRALYLVAALALCHVAGLRAYTSILSGTSPTALAGDRWAALLGVLYLFSYFACVVGAPVLLFGSLVLWVHGRVKPGSRPAP